jgi:hypothetical protein
MEANSLIHKPKKQKLNEEQGIDGYRKCLSNLPKDVLLDIPLKYVPYVTYIIMITKYHNNICHIYYCDYGV